MKKYSSAEIVAMKHPWLPTIKAKVLARAETEDWLSAIATRGGRMCQV